LLVASRVKAATAAADAAMITAADAVTTEPTATAKAASITAAAQT
jgi:hypothetical protein